MLKVIFTAEAFELDEEYFSTAEKLRELALTEYGCTEFASTTEGSTEVAISYWPSKEYIAKWRQNSEHLIAQTKGKSKWYKSYNMEIVELESEHDNGTYPVA